MDAEDNAVFGRLAVGNHMLTQKQLNDCIDTQKKLPIPRKLGEIAVSKGYLTIKSLRTLLDLQRRVQGMTARARPAASPGIQAGLGARVGGSNAGTGLVSGGGGAAGRRADLRSPSPLGSVALFGGPAPSPPAPIPAPTQGAGGGSMQIFAASPLFGGPQATPSAATPASSLPAPYPPAPPYPSSSPTGAPSPLAAPAQLFGTGPQPAAPTPRGPTRRPFPFGPATAAAATGPTDPTPPVLYGSGGLPPPRQPGTPWPNSQFTPPAGPAAGGPPGRPPFPSTGFRPPTGPPGFRPPFPGARPPAAPPAPFGGTATSGPPPQASAAPPAVGQGLPQTSTTYRWWKLPAQPPGSGPRESAPAPLAASLAPVPTFGWTGAPPTPPAPPPPVSEAPFDLEALDEAAESPSVSVASPAPTPAPKPAPTPVPMPRPFAPQIRPPAPASFPWQIAPTPESTRRQSSPLGFLAALRPRPLVPIRIDENASALSRLPAGFTLGGIDEFDGSSSPLVAVAVSREEALAANAVVALLPAPASAPVEPTPVSTPPAAEVETAKPSGDLAEKAGAQAALSPTFDLEAEVASIPAPSTSTAPGGPPITAPNEAQPTALPAPVTAPVTAPGATQEGNPATAAPQELSPTAAPPLPVPASAAPAAPTTPTDIASTPPLAVAPANEVVTPPPPAVDKFSPPAPAAEPRPEVASEVASTAPAAEPMRLASALDRTLVTPEPAASTAGAPPGEAAAVPLASSPVTESLVGPQTSLELAPKPIAFAPPPADAAPAPTPAPVPAPALEPPLVSPAAPVELTAGPAAEPTAVPASVPTFQPAEVGIGTMVSAAAVAAPALVPAPAVTEPAATQAPSSQALDTEQADLRYSPEAETAPVVLAPPAASPSEPLAAPEPPPLRIGPALSVSVEEESASTPAPAPAPTLLAAAGTGTEAPVDAASAPAVPSFAAEASASAETPAAPSLEVGRLSRAAPEVERIAAPVLETPPSTVAPPNGELATVEPSGASGSLLSPGPVAETAASISALVPDAGTQPAEPPPTQPVSAPRIPPASPVEPEVPPWLSQASEAEPPPWLLPSVSAAAPAGTSATIAAPGGAAPPTERPAGPSQAPGPVSPASELLPAPPTTPARAPEPAVPFLASGNFGSLLRSPSPGAGTAFGGGKPSHSAEGQGTAPPPWLFGERVVAHAIPPQPSSAKPESVSGEAALPASTSHTARAELQETSGGGLEGSAVTAEATNPAARATAPTPLEAPGSPASASPAFPEPDRDQDGAADFFSTEVSSEPAVASGDGDRPATSVEVPAMGLEAASEETSEGPGRSAADTTGSAGEQATAAHGGGTTLQEPPLDLEAFGPADALAGENVETPDDAPPNSGELDEFDLPEPIEAPAAASGQEAGRTTELAADLGVQLEEFPALAGGEVPTDMAEESSAASSGPAENKVDAAAPVATPSPSPFASISSNAAGETLPGGATLDAESLAPAPTAAAGAGSTPRPGSPTSADELAEQGPVLETPLPEAAKALDPGTGAAAASPGLSPELPTSSPAGAGAPVLPPVPAFAASAPPSTAVGTPPRFVSARRFPLPTDGDRQKLFSILRGARDAGASDVHIRSAVKPSLRLQGELTQIQTPALFPEEMERFVSALLTPEQEARFHETNDLTLAYEAPEVGRFRVQVFRDRRGLGTAFRVVPAKSQTLSDLLLPPVLSKVVTLPEGLVLVTGPGGSGRSTTLTALVDQMNRERRGHIVSVERPIEFLHASKNCLVSQREVGRHTESFARGVRGAVQEGPDVLLISDLCDQETTELALSAARGGVLVLAAMPTRNATSTLRRILGGFGPGREALARALLSETLRAVVTQQLVPTAVSKRRVVATEVLFNTHEVCSMIHDDRLDDLAGFLQSSSKAGMRLMDDSLVELVGGGLVAAEAAEILATDRELFKMAARRR
ncbi:MAG: PilT/PilU family type 4a pilus ATPase [Planctomycetes bacterium]|nr:PilT/PilU family type 4a pilus ATPase [Planctomycetota bacterium]